MKAPRRKKGGGVIYCTGPGGCNLPIGSVGTTLWSITEVFG